jgi:hypothetical protein
MHIQHLIENMMPETFAQVMNLTVSDIPDFKNLEHGLYEFNDFHKETPRKITVEMYLDGIEVSHRVLGAVSRRVA